MYYTKFLPLLLVAVAGCSAVSTHDVASEKPAQLDPLSASANEETNLYQQAITALNNSDYDQAETELKRISRTRPELAGPWINLALIDVKKNNIDSAEKNIANARKQNPKMPQVYNMLGYIDISRGQYKKAADDYRQAIALKEDYAMAHYNLALLHDIYIQDLKISVRHYKRYLELTGNQDKKTADWVLELERTIAKEAE
jgi:tetratricopeptide (TPR) repeat protein